MKAGVRLKLPATSANLGPAFDTAALALKLHIEIEAVEAGEFSVEASGRDAAICGALENNLLIETYCSVLKEQRQAVVPLALRMKNEIPLGMGCGSSATVRLAGVAFAVHFGGLGWTRAQILDEASQREGHPDNAAACWMGAMTVAALEGGVVHAVKIAPPAEWRAMVVLPTEPLATSKARAVLPIKYSRSEAVYNVQRSALLAAAFSAGRGDLLRIAMQDRLHQPYREKICPMLHRLLPMAGTHGVMGVALSGAGPAILLIVNQEAQPEWIRTEIARRTEDLVCVGAQGAEMIETSIENAEAEMESLESAAGS